MIAGFDKVAARVTAVSGGVCLLLSLCSASLAHAQQAGAGTWQTTLQARDLDGDLGNGPEAFYDTALNITWLADADAPETLGLSTYGNLTWDDAQQWVSSLTVGGVSGWRLPTVTGVPDGPCQGSWSGGICGHNVDTSRSELAHMFHVTLGNLDYYDTQGVQQNGFGLVNTGPFKNIAAQEYWSGKPYAQAPDLYFGFDMHYGGQLFYPRIASFHAWAVHDGDVSLVPEASSMSLMALGLGALALIARRQRHSPV